MAEKTISDLEQIAELTNDTKIPCEASTGNTSNASMSQILEFLHAPVEALQVSGVSPSYVLNPQSGNRIYTVDLSGINSSDTVQINLPAGSRLRERQIVMKIKNPNLATITVPGLQYKLTQYNVAVKQLQLILDFDQSLNAWVGGTLYIEQM